MNGLVTCLMATQSGRFEFFKAAVQDFLRQSYRDIRLQVVTSDPADEMDMYREWLSGLHRHELNFFHMPPGEGRGQQSTGAMRNRAITLNPDSRYFCAWDDDDRHHRDRIEMQLRAMSALPLGAASCSGAQYYHFLSDGTIQPVSWRRFPAPGIVLWRAELDVRYPDVSRAEDSSLYQQLKAKGPIGIVPQPGMYLRTIHTGNASGEEHHRRVARGGAWPRLQVLQSQRQIVQDLEQFGLQPPFKIAAAHGEIFTLPL